ncbi:unnamed protein product, partial [marine sediment metagenome]
PTIKTLASFLIEPRIRIALEGESERLDTVLKTGNAEYPCLFRRESWNSKRQLLAALPNMDLQFYGTDKDTQAILAMLTSRELPIRQGTKTLGRNGDLWVLRDGVFSKDGWVEDPALIYIPSEVEFDRRVHYPVAEDETVLIKQIIPLLLRLNEGRIIFPVLGWFFAIGRAEVTIGQPELHTGVAYELQEPPPVAVPRANAVVKHRLITTRLPVEGYPP